jgi:hypothetical protein
MESVFAPRKEELVCYKRCGSKHHVGPKWIATKNFCKSRKRKDGLHTICRKCSSIFAAKVYKKTKVTKYEVRMKRRAKIQKENKYYRGVKVPNIDGTLRVYGLDLKSWKELVDKQCVGNFCICPICEKPMKKVAIDHFHLPGWKKLPKEERRKHVRCLAHSECNWHFIAKNTLQTATNIVKMLEKHANKQQQK